MSDLKKIDYRKLTKEEPEQPPQEGPQGAIPTAQVQQQQPEAAEKEPFFSSLTNKWSFMGKKEKIEAVVFIVVVVCIIAVVVYYFVNRGARNEASEELHAPGAERSIDELMPN